MKQDGIILCCPNCYSCQKCETTLLHPFEAQQYCTTLFKTVFLAVSLISLILKFLPLKQTGRRDFQVFKTTINNCPLFGRKTSDIW